MYKPGDTEWTIAIGRTTAATTRAVLLVHGDSHVYTADNPLGLENFRRIVVHGETLPFEYLRLTVEPRAADLFSVGAGDSRGRTLGMQRLVAPA